MLNKNGNLIDQTGGIIKFKKWVFTHIVVGLKFIDNDLNIQFRFYFFSRLKIGIVYYIITTIFNDGQY